MKYSTVKNDLGHLCRTCLNDKYRIGLSPKDCRYSMYPAQCASCGAVKNIVEEVSAKKHLRILLSLRPRDKNDT